ncbi:hypothetical protein L1887_54823 [Cichorium endivia]|nr:hypothetical protein L1887_54823 [Cichorium endivia]
MKISPELKCPVPSAQCPFAVAALGHRRHAAGKFLESGKGDSSYRPGKALVRKAEPAPKDRQSGGCAPHPTRTTLPTTTSIATDRRQRQHEGPLAYPSRA